MTYPIILPENTVDHWQAAEQLDDLEAWDTLAIELLADGVDEPDTRIKDDILVLVLVACERANMAHSGLPFLLNDATMKVAA